METVLNYFNNTYLYSQGKTNNGELNENGKLDKVKEVKLKYGK
ncbi:MAG TPA: hypothetical protein VFI06_03000 [Chitinophagaceae bacterium]|nr:hypothetical protein [Chitinophagaceae bacterium]